MRPAPSKTGLLRAGTLLAFVLADGVAAHPRPTPAVGDVRLVGAVDTIADSDAYAAGKRLLASDDVVAALAAFQQALTADPGSVDAMNGIGVSYDRLGRGDLARKFYRAALSIDPRAASVLNNLGYSLFLSGDLTGAIEPLRAAAAADDLPAAAAATATLARLTEVARQTGAVLETVDRAAARIEVTSNGEQRLTFAPAAAREDVASTLGDDAAEIVVAAAWTSADDAALAVQVAAQQAADDAATRATQVAALADEARPAPVSAPATPAVVATAVQPPLAARHDAANRSAQHVGVARVDRLILAATGDTTMMRRRLPTSAGLKTAVHGADPVPPRLAFDSDDLELNVFAARMADSRMAASHVHDVAGDIIARFRG